MIRRVSLVTYSESEVVCERALFVLILRCVGFAKIKLHKAKRSMAVETQRDGTLCWLYGHMAVFFCAAAFFVSSGRGTFHSPSALPGGNGKAHENSRN